MQVRPQTYYTPMILTNYLGNKPILEFLSLNMWFSRNAVITAFIGASIVLARHP